MYLLRKPSSEAIRAFIASQINLNFTYHAVGATAAQPPPGYVVDHTRVRLGAGKSVFHAAQAGLRSWQHFQLGWIEPCYPSTPIEPGSVVAVLGNYCGLWSLNACRIIYTVDEQGPVTRFGFAYGTLPDHIESGEERFAIEWLADDSVWYDIVAFSRLNQWLARLGYPLIRRLQRRFARDSAAAMIRCSASSAE